MDVLAKSEGTGSSEVRRLSGVASANCQDAVGETVLQKGMDPRPAVERGFINWDHMEGPRFIIGYPTRCEFVYSQDHPELRDHPELGKSGLVLWAEGNLWEPGRHHGADEAWELAKALQGTPRHLSWSVQGRVVERDPTGTKILKSIVTQLALTHQPILQVSFADIAKSFGAASTPMGVMTTGSASPLLLENLDGKLTKTLYGYCKSGQCFDNKGRFYKGVRGALAHLHYCHDESIPDSKDYLQALIRSGIMGAGAGA